MKITCWGARGSLPAPGPHTLRYGGNTACVSVEIDGRVLVLDAGSGIRTLGRQLLDGSQEIFMIISHLHLDHICGFPFFAPLYEPGRRVHVACGPDGDGIASPLDVLDGVRFPLRASDLPADIVRGADGIDYLRRAGFDIRGISLNHSGPATGFRIVHRGASFVYIPDNELGPVDDADTFAPFVEFCRGADLLFHDAQYTEADMDLRDGWGHSSVERVCDLAIEAQVRHVALFHHDPDRSDDALDTVLATTSERLAAKGIRCSAAYEGMVIDLVG